MRSALRWRPGAGAVAALVVGVVFALWVLGKALPFLGTETQATFSTPTAEPKAQMALPGKGTRMCTSGITYGPSARYVEITVRSGRYDLGPLALQARARGYAADATVRADGPKDGVVVVPIRPAPRGVRQGSLCVVNHGRHTLTVFGVPPGRGTSAFSATTIDGKPSQIQMSLTLLTKPSATVRSRLGAMFRHASSFRPFTAWEAWILALLVAVGAPVALAVALSRAADEDESAPRTE